MNIARRRLSGARSEACRWGSPRRAAFAQSGHTLKISHQFPGGSIDQGDFRDRLAASSRGGREDAPTARSSSTSIRTRRWSK